MRDSSERYDRSDLATFAIMCAITVAILTVSSFVDWDRVNQQRHDEQYPGAFVIQRDGLYLAWVDASRNTVPDYSITWVESPAEASRFADREDAAMSAKDWDAVPVRLQEVYP